MPLASLIERRTQSALNDKLPILKASGIIERKNKKQYSTMETSETGIEKIIVERFGGQNGYECKVFFCCPVKILNTPIKTFRHNILSYS
jgi:hypothetical protein